MKVLWFSTEATRYSSQSVACYGSSGLIDALQDTLLENASIELGMAFLYDDKACKEKRGKVTYYPMLRKEMDALQKLFFYWYGYKKRSLDLLLPEMLDVINDFKPDVIQIFGIESPFACILGQVDIPVVVHLQGFLNPTSNAFYPQGMNHFTFLLKSFSYNEWFIRNGQNFAAKYMHVRSKTERKYMRHMQFSMGRTNWDRHITSILAPQSQYFHVGEMLRDEFAKAQPWKMPPLDKYILTSTISQTVYKGLDVILKTAKLLKEVTGLNFKWQVIGVQADHQYVRFFEKHCNIKSSEVNVEYEGICNAGQICNKLLESHVYVHPSYVDNSPNSLCEAQLIGLPVIGTYVGGIPSLVTHEKTGLLVPANDPYELTYWLQYLYQHPEIMIELGNAARATALIRHSKENIISDLLTIYRQISK